MTPEISVIMPVRDTARYVEQSVSSVLDQTFKNLELIIVDDGSCDRSMELISRFRDERMRIITQAARGPGAARNLGLELARGHYIMFIDSDDWLFPNACSALHKHAELLEADITLAEYVHYHDRTDEMIAHMEGLLPVSFESTRSYSGHELGRDLVKIAPVCWGRLYLASFLRNHHILFPEVTLHEDLGFVYRVLLKAQRIAFMKRPLHVYRQRSDSLTTRSDQARFDVFAVFEPFRRELTDPEVSAGFDYHRAKMYFDELERIDIIHRPEFYATLRSCLLDSIDCVTFEKPLRRRVELLKHEHYSSFVRALRMIELDELIERGVGLAGHWLFRIDPTLHRRVKKIMRVTR